jgi:hypothetical protein
MHNLIMYAWYADWMNARSGLASYLGGRQTNGHIHDIDKSIRLNRRNGSDLVDECVKSKLLQDYGSMVATADLIVEVAAASGMPFGEASMILRATSIFEVCIMHA